MKVIAAIGFLLSVFGAYEAFKISHLHFGTVESCPTLAVVPACYVVLVCYSLMSVAWGARLMSKIERIRPVVFWAGFTPAFLLALAGSTGEIFGFVECPQIPGGLPKCFLSLGFVLVLAALWSTPKFIRAQAQPNLE